MLLKESSEQKQKFQTGQIPRTCQQTPLHKHTVHISLEGPLPAELNLR